MSLFQETRCAVSHNISKQVSVNISSVYLFVDHLTLMLVKRWELNTTRVVRTEQALSKHR